MFTIKDCKLVLLTILGSICLFSMRAHDLSVQNAVKTFDCKQMGKFECFSYKSMFLILTQLSTSIYCVHLL